MECSKCEHGNRTGARICASCGHRLAESVPVKPQTPPSPGPSSFANSHYQVKRLLGEEGIKRVCLTYDTRLDQGVAFSLIKTERPDDVARTPASREARAMGRLLSA